QEIFLMMRRQIVVVLVFTLILIATFAFSSIIYEDKIAHAAYVRALPESTGQTLVDPSLKVELTFKDVLKGPITGMAFLGPDDILVLEKNTGKVQRVLNGSLQDTPLLQVKVETEVELVMLGIAVSKSEEGKSFVFLYYTEANSSGIVIGNRLYKYELVDNRLVNPLL